MLNPKCYVAGVVREGDSDVREASHTQAHPEEQRGSKRHAEQKEDWGRMVSTQAGPKG